MLTVPQAMFGAALASGRLSLESNGDQIRLVATVFGLRTPIAFLDIKTGQLYSAPPARYTQAEIRQTLGSEPEPPTPTRPTLRVVK